MSDTMRAFIAVEIPKELHPALAKLRDDLPSEGLRKVSLENLHFTLKFLGSVPTKQLASIEQALRTVKFDPFQITLKGVGVFPNENYIRVVWVGSEGSELPELAKKINDVLPDFKKEKFSAHLTIARVKRKIDIRNFLEKYANESFGSFEVRAFYLKQSELSREGPKYTTLATFTASE